MPTHSRACNFGIGQRLQLWKGPGVTAWLSVLKHYSTHVKVVHAANIGSAQAAWDNCPFAASRDNPKNYIYGYACRILMSSCLIMDTFGSNQQQGMHATTASCMPVTAACHFVCDNGSTPKQNEMGI
jgi:hypothetical protein